MGGLTRELAERRTPVSGRLSAMRAVLLLAAASLSAPVAADTLEQALSKAYVTNPTLNAARSNLMALDETYPIQRAPGLPDLSIGSNYNENVLIPPGQFIVIPRSLQSQMRLNVPIYTGGRIKNAMRSADGRIAAGQEQLRGVEAQVFSQVVAAYNDVLRDVAIVEFNRANIKNLDVTLRQSRDRFEVGDTTRTDVAQAEARLAQAQGDLENAEANLIASRERYILQVGEAPGELAPPPPLPGLPDNVDEALTIAIHDNPDIAAALKNLEATGFDVKVARAGRLPTLSAFGNLNRSDNFGGAIVPPGFPDQPASQTSGVVGFQLNLPLYQGGLPAAQIRQAQARQSEALENGIGIERQVVQTVRAAYAAWKASIAIIASAEAAISANTLSLEGVKAENSVGTRTVIEVLNAEQELNNSRVLLATARRNAYVAAFTLLAAMGNAEARDLSLDGVTLYDSKVNARAARGSYFDWSGRPVPAQRSTRTTSTPAQTAKIIGPTQP
jgi:outer membrane protein